MCVSESVSCYTHPHPPTRPYKKTQKNTKKKNT